MLRARTEFEEFGHDRIRIIVTELPYQVNKKLLVKNIADQVRDKRLEGISGLRDESDRNGMRIVIEIKKDANPQVVLNRLFSQTQLQSSFAVTMLALTDNQRQPKIFSLRHMIDEYLTFQEEIITRRTVYDRRKAQERAHLLEGLLIAQANIDEVIKIIRESYDDAKENLMARFSLDEIQAQAILDMQLKRLQGLEEEKLRAEYEELERRIAYYDQLLSDESMLKGVLKEELIAIRDKYGDDRRTEIMDVEDDLDIEGQLIEEEECVFTLTQGGYLKRTPVSAYRTQRRGGKGVNAQTLKEEDYVKRLFTASTHDFILFFTNIGKVHRVKGYRVPEASRTAKGTPIVNVLPLETGEAVTAMLHVKSLEEENQFLLMATRMGTVKRVTLQSINTARKSGIRALSLEEDDELICAAVTDGTADVMLLTHQGMAIRFHESDVRCMGRDAVGVRGIKLREGDWVVGGEIVQEDRLLFSVTENGYGKRTDPGEFSVQNRGGQGVKGYQCTQKTCPVAAVAMVAGQEDLMMISDDGTIIRTPAADISVISRATQGVKVMTVADGVKVIGLAVAEPEEESDGEESRPGERRNRSINRDRGGNRPPLLF